MTALTTFVTEMACLGWASTQATVCGVAIRRARRTYSVARADGADGADRADGAPTRDVLLVRPVAGDEPGLEERLVARGGVHRVVIAVRSQEDAATPAARAAIACIDGEADATLVETHAEGPNMKASQLAHVVTHHREGAQIVVVADSDVALGPNDVTALLDALAHDTKLGAAWCPVTFVPPQLDGRAIGAGDRATVAILVASLHAFPILAAIDRSLFVGKLFAIRADALAATGGFEAQTRVLGEDVELARALRRAGWRTAAIAHVARATRSTATLRETASRMARWLFVVKGQRPALVLSYPLLLAAVVPFALLVALLVCGPTPSFVPSCSLAAVVAARLAVSFEGRRLAGIRRGVLAGLVDIVLADLVLGFAVVSALGSRTLAWRGESLRLEGARLTRERAPTELNSERPR